MTKKIQIEATGRFDGADSIENILCLATLIATKEISINSTVKEAYEFFDIIRGCNNCNHNDNCLACIINGG